MSENVRQRKRIDESTNDSNKRQDITIDPDDRRVRQQSSILLS